MKVALVNPPWSLEGGGHFGCREPHLPLEYGYARALLERAGHEVAIFDAHLFQLSLEDLRLMVADYRPDMTTVTTAPSYRFWRHPLPELRVPQRVAAALRGFAGKLVAVGPHASTSPRTTLEKLGVDVAVIGECEEVLVELAGRSAFEWSSIGGIAYFEEGRVVGRGSPRMAQLDRLPSLRWSEPYIAAHRHQHHRFDGRPVGPGAEIEASRGYPVRRSFWARPSPHDSYRQRLLATTLDELDGLLADGVRYVYFVDDVFLPDRFLLEALARRDVAFGVQVCMDDWDKEMLDLLGRAGCVSLEARVEGLTERGGALWAKRGRAPTDELTELFIYAKRSVAFVHANLLDSDEDDPRAVAAYRAHLGAHGVWASDAGPSFPFPEAPDDAPHWTEPESRAWEPVPLAQLEPSRP